MGREVIATTPVFSQFVARFQAVADPARAQLQQAYMKSASPFFGVASAGVAQICREVLTPWPFDSAASWREAVLELWHGATHRELRYAALALLEHKEARVYQGLRPSGRAPQPEEASARSPQAEEASARSPQAEEASARPPQVEEASARAVAAMGLYEALLVTGAWWDLVDPLASRRLGAMLLEHNAIATATVLRWSQGTDVWLRRAAIIAQLKLRGATDRRLLVQVIEPALEAPEFWLRKAIGWALRQHARVDPAWVRSTVAALGPRLSPLSRREALKHLG